MADRAIGTARGTVLAYHARTKHHFHRYAAGPHGLDWDSQPDPFRSFAGATVFPLPLLAPGQPGIGYAELFSPAATRTASWSLATLAGVLELGLGLAAWKAYGRHRWALRCNPSSGNLHPTEAYFVGGAPPGLAFGVYHYLSRDHVLERRARLPDAPWPGPGGLIALTSVPWREAWKYGERAWRYCLLDAGHAAASLRLAAACFGLGARLCWHYGDDDLATLTGIDRAADFGDAEEEIPELALWLGADARCPEGPLPSPVDWQGRANRLSPYHAHEWPAISEAVRAAHKPPTATTPQAFEPLPPLLASDATVPAATLIRRRRSAQAYDGHTGMEAARFFRLLDATRPRPGVPAPDVLPWSPAIHLLFFVHRVEGLPPGLYLLARSAAGEKRLRHALARGCDWERPAHAPAGLAVYRLAEGDVRDAAKRLSCHQDIAADGAFALAMLGELDGVLEEGPWGYRRLLVEAGAIGQVLYLEAEAAGLSGTGMGCFFDDPVAELIGLKDPGIISVYHFAVGRALPDERLATVPGYAHLGDRFREPLNK